MGSLEANRTWVSMSNVSLLSVLFNFSVRSGRKLNNYSQWSHDAVKHITNLKTDKVIPHMAGFTTSQRTPTGIRWAKSSTMKWKQIDNYPNQYYDTPKKILS